MSIHNSVNERAWQEVLRWERLHCCDSTRKKDSSRHEDVDDGRGESQDSQCCDIQKVKLVKFMGRPREISLKARVLNAFGYKLPFDRHDWIIDRCGTEQRYIIDFYNGAPVKGALTSIRIDARPALDNSSSVMTMAYMTLLDTAQALGLRSQSTSTTRQQFEDNERTQSRNHADQ